MTNDKIKAVEVEIERFQKRVNDLRETPKKQYQFYQPRETGAIRRASLDLTRALAQLRKP